MTSKSSAWFFSGFRFATHPTTEPSSSGRPASRLSFLHVSSLATGTNLSVSTALYITSTLSPGTRATATRRRFAASELHRNLSTSGATIRIPAFLFPESAKEMFLAEAMILRTPAIRAPSPPHKVVGNRNV